MGLSKYEVVIPGRNGGTKTTLLLSDEDAKRAGVFDQKAEKPAAPKRTRKARTPANKAAAPAANKAGKPDDDKSATPATTPAAPTEEATDPDASE